MEEKANHSFCEGNSQTADSWGTSSCWVSRKPENKSQHEVICEDNWVNTSKSRLEQFSDCCLLFVWAEVYHISPRRMYNLHSVQINFMDVPHLVYCLSSIFDCHVININFNAQPNICLLDGCDWLLFSWKTVIHHLLTGTQTWWWNLMDGECIQQILPYQMVSSFTDLNPSLICSINVGVKHEVNVGQVVARGMML